MTDFSKQHFILSLNDDNRNKQTLNYNYFLNTHEDVELTDEMIDNYFGLQEQSFGLNKEYESEHERQEMMNMSGGRKLEDVLEDLSGKRKTTLTGGTQTIPNDKLKVYPYSLF